MSLGRERFPERGGRPHHQLKRDCVTGGGGEASCHNTQIRKSQSRIDREVFPGMRCQLSERKVWWLFLFSPPNNFKVNPNPWSILSQVCQPSCQQTEQQTTENYTTTTKKCAITVPFPFFRHATVVCCFISFLRCKFERSDASKHRSTPGLFEWARRAVWETTM